LYHFKKKTKAVLEMRDAESKTDIRKATPRDPNLGGWDI
jgi:hypothetical protein